ncbi:MAG TPA: YceI family protein [Adhaeribacter sp.]|nr:YceI family protein [Adhaeribacter sp.]
MKTAKNNKMQIISQVLFAFALFLILPNFVNAQVVYNTNGTSDKTIKVFGTSNVHDWDMKSTAIESHGMFVVNPGNKLVSISNLTFTTTAKGLKSNSNGMDDRTHKLLKADQHPTITYKLQSAVISPTQKDNTYLIRSTGILTIAGVSQTITMDVTGVVNNQNTITCSGSKKIKLTDYKLTPPSYMAGAMKVGNELTIDFDIAFKKAG